MSLSTQPSGGNDELRGLIAAVWNGTIRPSERDRLEDLLAESEAAREFYLSCMDLHSQLLWQFRGKNKPSVPLQAPLGRSSPVLGFFGDTWRGTTGYLAEHEFFTGYVVATVLSAIVAVIGLNVYVTHYLPREFAAAARQPNEAGVLNPSELEPKIVSVGQITGMVDCRWVDAHQAPAHNMIKLHDKFELTSGLMEITYHAGAKVILQGPCTYEVESAVGGFLSLGKLTARVEKKGERGEGRGERAEGGGRRAEGAAVSGQWSVASEKEERAEGRGESESTGKASGTLAPSPQPLAPSPLFAVRTPTAVVTDLGTEFGVEVDKGGETFAHVFVGVVVVADAKNGGPVRLGANQSARVNPTGKGTNHVVVVRGEDAKPEGFVRIGQMAAKSKEVRERPLKQFREWQAFSEQLRRRDDLLAYYDFQRDADHPRDANDCEILRNRSKAGPKFDGTLNGTLRMGMAQGRFAGKEALQFAFVGDGVQINLPGQLRSITATAWVNVGELANQCCGILLSDEYFERSGALHWQLMNDGVMNVAISESASESGAQWRSDPLLDPARPSGWHHLAAVRDEVGTVLCYFDGRRQATALFTSSDASIPVEIGPATIGSWSCRERALGGRIDELAIFGRALSSEEIQRMFEAGNPAGSDQTHLNEKKKNGG